MVEDLRRGDDSTGFLPFVKSICIFVFLAGLIVCLCLTPGWLPDILKGMNSICFAGVLALCCGCVFGDTAPVPVADGGKIVLREFPSRGVEQFHPLCGPRTITG